MDRSPAAHVLENGRPLLVEAGSQLLGKIKADERIRRGSGQEGDVQVAVRSGIAPGA